MAPDFAVRLADFVRWLDQAIVEALVISVAMIVDEIGRDGIAKHLLAEEDHSGKTLGFDAEVKPFHMSIQIGASGWQSHRFHTGILQHRSEGTAEVGITVQQDILLVF